MDYSGLWRWDNLQLLFKGSIEPVHSVQVLASKYKHHSQATVPIFMPSSRLKGYADMGEAKPRVVLTNGVALTMGR